jgi:enediyne biosynthesis protein E4
MRHGSIGFCVVLLAILGSTGCGDEAAAADPNASSGAGASFSFVDVARESGLDLKNVCGDPRRWYIVESNGNGAAWLDYDGDGDMDLYLANGAGLKYLDDGKRLEVVHSASSKLYRNDFHGSGKLHFTDVTAETGAGRADWINAVATGDVDNDGDPDLYLACFGPDVFLRNEAGRFVDATAEAGLGCELWGASAAFGDADNDGDLDLYVANYCLFDCEHPPLGGKRNSVNGIEVGWGPEEENKQGANAGAPDRFYRNDGHGSFTDATAQAGLALEKPLCSYAVVFSDVDGDGWQDLLVANDLQPANLFHNTGEGTFEEQGLARGFAFEASGKPTGAMGLSTEDFDGDGDVDVFRTNFDFEANSLHRNDGHGHFKDVAAELGLATPSLDRLGWGGGWFDADCDGDLDLLVANGHVYPQGAQIGMGPWLQVSQLYEAVQADGKLRYVDATARAGADLGLKRSARGIAFGDPDDDGDVDALVVDVDEQPRLLENRTPKRGHWIAIRTVGTASNRDGIGARVLLKAGGRTWMREMKTTQGLYSSHDPRLHFGLGPVGAVEAVEVRWPSGRRSVIEAPALDRFLTVTEPAEVAK